MSALLFRPATDIERGGIIRNQWLAQVLPRGTDAKDGRHRAGRPGASLSTWAIRQALQLLVVHILADPEVTVLVAELDDVPSELLGWVAFTPNAECEGVTVDNGAVHFIRVPSGYGRRKLATELIRQAGADLAHTWMTPNGRAFAAAVFDKPG